MTGLQTLVALLLVVYPSQACFPKATTTPPATCPAVSVPTDGVVHYYDGRKVNSYLIYFCNPDFTLTGNTMRKCESGLKWNGVGDVAGEVTCARMSCPEFIVSNAVVTYTPNRLATAGMATIMCNDGYIRVGTSPRTCEAALTWSGDAPTCEKKCEEFGSTPAVTYTTTAVGGFHSIGTVATFTCPAGQNIQTNAQRTCKDGTPPAWDGVAATCAAKCPVLDAPANGGITYGTTDRAEADVATYACTGDAVPQEDGATLTRTCQSDLTWDGKPITCAEACPMLSFDNGLVTYTSAQRMPPQIATYKCNSGYAFQGTTNTRYCAPGTTYTWDGTPTVAAGWLCDVVCPEIVATGKIWTVAIVPTSRGAMSVATHTCAMAGHGFTSGDIIRTCQTDLSWSGTEPVCSQVCPEIVTTGKTWTVTYSPTSRAPASVATHACTTAGDTVSTGDAMRTCQADFTWGGTEPVCTTPSRRRLLAVLLGDRD